MASSYTTNLKIQEIANGEQSGIWGSSTNTNWTLIEQAVAGVQTITMANANYTLSNLNGILDEARNMVLIVQGTINTSYQVIIPSNQTKFYIISNQTTGGYAITIGTSGGTLVSIPNGTTAQVYTDGTTTYSAQTGSAGDFRVNGNLTVTGNETEVGTLSASTLSVSNNATFAVGPTAPTATTGTNTTQLATTAFVNASIAAAPVTITGAILMWPTTTAPSGYLLCNGSAVSRTTYSGLFSVVGTTFGTGDGSTTFNLPNYTDNMPIGVGTIATAVGITGGSATTTVLQTNLPNVNFTVTDPGHSHAIIRKNSTSTVDEAYMTRGGGDVVTNGATNTATTGITVSSGGSGTALNTISPYLGINFIIKT
jgi:microcystin-dependent protein